MEVIPKQENVIDAVDKLLERRLQEIEVPENIPTSVEHLYRLEQFLINIDTPEWSNEDAPLARTAEENLAEALASADLSHKHFQEYSLSFRPVHPNKQSQAA